MAAISPDSAMQDLKITHKHSTLVFPISKQDKRILFLSNLDQFANFNVETAFFFRANLDFPPEIVSRRLKIALEKLLVPYDFMAGRVKWNNESGRAEIECNAAGAGFVVASSEFSVDEIGDLACPNLGFRQLAVQNLDHPSDNNENHDQPLCIFQVTSFKCGGFAIGMSINHMLFDGLGVKMFLENLASQAFDDEDRPLPFVPFHNRHLLAARSPPIVTFPHPEFFKPAGPVLGLPVQVPEQALSSRVFKLSSTDIGFLKSEADVGRVGTSIVVGALLWRCRALSDNKLSADGRMMTSIMTVMDLRSRLMRGSACSNYLPAEYCGNAIYGGYASGKCEEIGRLMPFSEVVKMVLGGIGEVTDEYVESAIDWMEINRGVPLGDCMVSSWLRLGLDDVAFPWGPPACCVPVVNQMERFCWIFPCATVAGGVNVLVQRPTEEEMETFQFHFLNFFAKNI